ncbi:MAG: tryptophan-rich sensory protein [Culicoidibacterales bacterium]
MSKKSSMLIRWGVVLSFIAMVVVNALANILPINGITSGAVSDSYANLFAPAGITFTIWSVIYIFLGIYSVYQLGVFQKAPEKMPNPLLDEIGVYFIISSLANLTWIFAWHYQIIWLSLIFMLIIFVMLALIVVRIRRAVVVKDIIGTDRLLIRIPFSVYFGWITVATIANVVTLLVSLNFDGFGFAEPIWMIAIVLIGMAIGVATVERNRDIAYGLVIVWAYTGIIIKHVSATGFDLMYPEIIWTVAGAIIVLLISIGYVAYQEYFKK